MYRRGKMMLLTIFLAIVFCAAVTLMLLSAVAFIQKKEFFYPEVEGVYPLKKYGFNIKSQLLKLLVIFPAVSALAAWICTLFQ